MSLKFYSIHNFKKFDFWGVNATVETNFLKSSLIKLIHKYCSVCIVFKIYFICYFSEYYLCRERYRQIVFVRFPRNHTVQLSSVSLTPRKPLLVHFFSAVKSTLNLYSETDNEETQLCD
jgi:hypothetical protein